MLGSTVLHPNRRGQARVEKASDGSNAAEKSIKSNT